MIINKPSEAACYAEKCAKLITDSRVCSPHHDCPGFNFTGSSIAAASTHTISLAKSAAELLRAVNARPEDMQQKSEGTLD